MTAIEDLCEEYLKKNSISYLRNKELIIKSQPVTEFDFIIPGAVVEVKSSYNGNSKNKLARQLTKMEKYIPQDFVIYLYVHTDETKNLTADMKQCDRVKVIKDFSEIKHQHYPYYTTDTKVIRSFGSEENEVHDELVKKYKEICTTQWFYDRATTHFTDQELKRFQSLTKFKIVDSEPSRCIILARSEVAFKMFDNFVEVIHAYELLNKEPVREVPGISVKCQKCQKINTLERIKDNICYLCGRFKLVKAPQHQQEKIKRKKIMEQNVLVGKRGKKKVPDIKIVVDLLKKGLTFKEIRQQLNTVSRSKLVGQFVAMVKEFHEGTNLEVITKEYNLQPNDVESLSYHKHFVNLSVS